VKQEHSSGSSGHRGVQARKERQKEESALDAKLHGRWGKLDDSEKEEKNDEAEVKKEEPNFAPSGLLQADVNSVNGVVVKYAEPVDARLPDKRWRLYVFKGDQMMDPLHIHRQSHYLFGRDRKVVHVPVDHPSASKQHAVLQFRQKEALLPDGSLGLVIKPYIIDLGSTNKTMINKKPIEPAKYVELLENDVINFGLSSRDYVLLHDKSTGKDLDSP